MDWREHISADPAVMVGKPVITGTRIPVDLLLEKIAFQSFDEILLDYPGLTRADSRRSFCTFCTFWMCFGWMTSYRHSGRALEFHRRRKPREPAHRSCPERRALRTFHLRVELRSKPASTRPPSLSKTPLSPATL
jgi:uncharacterized protein (DUF433 family)